MTEKEQLNEALDKIISFFLADLETGIKIDQAGWRDSTTSSTDPEAVAVLLSEGIIEDDPSGAIRLKLIQSTRKRLKSLSPTRLAQIDYFLDSQQVIEEDASMENQQTSGITLLIDIWRIPLYPIRGPYNGRRKHAAGRIRGIYGLYKEGEVPVNSLYMVSARKMEAV